MAAVEVLRLRVIAQKSPAATGGGTGSGLGARPTSTQRRLIDMRLGRTPLLTLIFTMTNLAVTDMLRIRDLLGVRPGVEGMRPQASREAVRRTRWELPLGISALKTNGWQHALRSNAWPPANQQNAKLKFREGNDMIASSRRGLQAVPEGASPGGSVLCSRVQRQPKRG